MRKIQQMSQEDIEVVVKASYVLGEINKKYKHPHGKNPMGIVILALDSLKKLERAKKEVKK